jgi:hypothetical protein
MYITQRPLQEKDFEKACSFVCARISFRDADKKDILALWRAVFLKGLVVATSVQDMDAPENDRLAGFGISWAVPEEVIQKIQKATPPNLAAFLLERWRKKQPAFSSRQEAHAQELAGGVSLANFGYGIHPRYSAEQQVKVKESMTVQFAHHMEMHRLRHFAEECFGKEEKARYLAIGLETWRDYKEFLGTPLLPKRDEAEHPYVVGVDFQKVRRLKKARGTYIGWLALLGPARFGFEPRQQEQLRAALDGATDEELSKKLHLSLVAIKKRWQGIYERLEDKETNFFETASDGPGALADRQKQRKRTVLEFIRKHPEELWPVGKPK